MLPESDYIYDFSFPEEEGKPNPHLWTDPTLRDQVRGPDPRRVLQAPTRTNASYYADNYDAFDAKANELADAVRADQADGARGRRSSC